MLDEYTRSAYYISMQELDFVIMTNKISLQLAATVLNLIQPGEEDGVKKSDLEKIRYFFKKLERPVAAACIEIEMEED